MANISQIEVNGTTYDICDATARDSINKIELTSLATWQSFPNGITEGVHTYQWTMSSDFILLDGKPYYHNISGDAAVRLSDIDTTMISNTILEISVFVAGTSSLPCIIQNYFLMHHK